MNENLQKVTYNRILKDEKSVWSQDTRITVERLLSRDLCTVLRSLSVLTSLSDSLTAEPRGWIFLRFCRDPITFIRWSRQKVMIYLLPLYVYQEWRRLPLSREITFNFVFLGGTTAVNDLDTRSDWWCAPINFKIKGYKI